MRRRMVAVGAGMLVLTVLSGWGRAADHAGTAAGAEEPSAARAVAAIATEHPGASAQIPADFPAVVGYRPGVQVAGGRSLPTRPDGGCTSPFGPTAFGFGPACRQHDLGYDLLRYADARGRPLGPWARHAIDDRFWRQLRSHCDDPGCLVMAAAYAASVHFNSWRQGWGVPVVEHVRDLLPGSVAGLTIALLIGSARLGASSRAVTLAAARWLWHGAAPCLLPRTGRLVVATAALALAVQPGVIPRPVWVQAVIGGLAAAQAYAVATVVRRLARPALGAVRRLAGGPRSYRPESTLAAMRERSPVAALWVVVVLLAVSAVTAHAGQRRLASTTGMAAPTLSGAAAATAMAVAVSALAIGGGAVVGIGARRARRARRARHASSPWRGVGRRAAAVFLTPALALTGCATAAQPSVAAWPTGAVGSGGTVGGHGRAFLARAPSAAEIGAVTGRRALAPLRLYVGRDEAGTATARAQLAVRRLDQAGAFERSTVLIAVPTGSGWVNPAAPSALEYLYGGDAATVAVQYGASPSWMAYLRGGEGVQASVRSLLDAVAARAARQPPGRRPRVLLHGESLGGWGGLTAYPRPQEVTRRADGALWVGVPAGAPAPGEPPASTTAVTATSAPGRIRVLAHADDPVPSWSPRLMLEPARSWPRRWLPVVTFWQVTGDVVVAQRTPPGHGHRYGPELVDAWRDLAPPVDVPTAAPADRQAAIRAVLAESPTATSPQGETSCRC